jgi:predicted transglutaminase-like cysteine proteinase
MNKFVVSIATAALMSVVSISGAAASAPTSMVHERVTASGPLSFQMFCAVNPRECKGGGASKVSLSAEVIKVLQSVNSKVNRSIRPKLDSASFQMWRINPSSGDCKSYAISKRHELIRAGLPASALRIAYVKTRAGEGHAVLVVKTSQGDYALDNLTGDIKSLRETGYRVVAMSGADPKRWS